MIKTIILTLVIVSTQGCFHQTVNSNDIYRAEKFCKDKNMQVVEIQANFAGAEYVTCSDGKESPI